MIEPNKKIRIAVLFGGRSGEHEVSLVSAQSVIDNLDKEKYEIIPIGITKQGKWIAGQDAMRLLKSNQAPEESNMIIPAEPMHDLKSMPPKPSPVPPPMKGGGVEGIDVVFPVLHGPYGEDGTMQGFLEFTGLPYVGCGVLASSVCMDKVMQKKVLEAEDIKQTPYIWFWAKDWNIRKEEIIKHGIAASASTPPRNDKLSYPLFVKPANLGSSVGITKAHNREEFIEAVEEALQYDRKVIVEQGVEKPREIEVAVLGNQEPKASVPGEIIPSNEFYDYDAKYVDGKSKAIIPADLSAEQIKEIQAIAIKAYKALNCEGMARVDFLLAKDNTLYLNELNTIPGFTSISMYSKLWQASGLSYSELLDELINLARERSEEKKHIKISYQPKNEWYNK